MAAQAEGGERIAREQHRTLTPNLSRTEPPLGLRARTTAACKRAVNSVLGLLRVRLTHVGFPVNDDFNACLLSDDARELWVDKVAAALSSHVQGCGLSAGREAIRQHVRDYLSLAPSFRLKQLGGGMGFLGGLKLFVFARVFEPSVVIESGVWRGFTTEVFHHATTARCRILSFDINLDKVEFRSEKQQLFEGDWMDFVGDQELDSDTCLALFDDHVSQVRRIRESGALGLKHLLFDDDYALSEIFADKWPAVPTASMCMDPWCHERSEVEWRREGAHFRASWSCEELADTARQVDLHAPFPSLHEQAGFQPGSKISYLRLQDASARVSSD